MTCIEISSGEEALLTGLGLVFGLFCLIVLGIIGVFLAYVFFWWLYGFVQGALTELSSLLKRLRG